MKKILLLAILCGGFFLNSKAQTFQPLSVGIKAGLSLATSSVDNYTMRGGLASGIVADYNIDRQLFFRSGIDFMMKGGKYNQYFEGMTAGVNQEGRKTISIHLNYIQLPVMIGYRWSLNQDIKIYIAGGLYGAVAVYGKGKYTYNTNLAGIKNEHYEYNNLDELQFKKVDYGLVGSFGADYQKYSINIGYEYGLLNINKTNYSNPSPITNGDGWHNMNATCTIIYKL